MSETPDYFILTIKMKQLGEKLFKRNTPPNLYIILKTFSEKSETGKGKNPFILPLPPKKKGLHRTKPQQKATASSLSPQRQYLKQ